MISVMRYKSQNPVMTMNLQCRCHINARFDGLMNKSKTAVKSLYGLVSVIIKAKKYCYIQILSVCFAFLSVSERHCVMHYILKYARWQVHAAHSVFNSAC